MIAGRWRMCLSALVVLLLVVIAPTVVLLESVL
jgi:hypothetical protein